MKRTKDRGLGNDVTTETSSLEEACDKRTCPFTGKGTGNNRFKGSARAAKHYQYVQHIPTLVRAASIAQALLEVLPNTHNEI